MIVARNILLAGLTGARIHCQHLSAAGSVKLLREAKKRGVPISGEACPHHFTLTDSAVAGSEKFWGADGKAVFGFESPAADRPLRLVSGSRRMRTLLRAIWDGLPERSKGRNPPIV